MDYCFDDVLMKTRFSKISSRREVCSRTMFLGQEYLPIISSNMDSVASKRLIGSMQDEGAQGCLHRFQSIEANLDQLVGLRQYPFASIGVAKEEVERFIALRAAGVRTFVIDVAHGANIEVVEQVKRLNEYHRDFFIVVGNFDSRRTIEDFLYHLGNKNYVDAFKVGIGSGAGCLTRVVTGCGRPTFASVQDCSVLDYPIIADGGIRNSGDYAKAIAAGARMVMMGKVFAATEEAPGEIIVEGNTTYKLYRGSASHESYVAQNKVASWRTPEGACYKVEVKETVKDVLQRFDAGLKSAMSYLGVDNIDDMQAVAEFIQVTPLGVIENGAHGRE